ncbi:hypothetical protein Hsw_PA0209 (plasmid) [Hymenobacter swuensis DY53]|uniref:Uncharacterized protein n=2 Tax=Hymenobacter TaxID=89966 RepID=W8EUY0_9BACT|nr:hypothetical protein Hsw_PA0209 [Hymenobacter swuensis DY53]
MLKSDKLAGLMITFWDDSPSKTSEYLSNIGLSDQESTVDKENGLYITYEKSEGKTTVFVKATNTASTN